MVYSAFFLNSDIFQLRQNKKYHQNLLALMPLTSAQLTNHHC